MNKTNEKMTGGTLRFYQTPTMDVLDIYSEGMLCVSSKNSTIESAEEEDSWGTF